MRKRLNCIIEDLDSDTFFNQISLTMLRTIDLSLEAKLAGRLFQYTDPRLKT